MLYRISNKKRKIMWPILILRYSLPLLSFGFYGQIFYIFTTIFYCRKKESNTSPYFKCRPDLWINQIKPIAGIAMFLNFLIVFFITNSLYYKPVFLKTNNDLLKKWTSLPDIILLFTKMIIISIFVFDKEVETEHWAILFVLVIVTGINASLTVFYKNRQNIVLLALNNFFSMILFLGFLVLFIAKIFKFLNFDGSIFLLFVCTFLIILYIALYKKNYMFISKDYKNINNENEYLFYVSNFYNYIINKNSSRIYLHNLLSIIYSIEENCVIQNCPLQKYLINFEKGYDCQYLLLRFCEKLFRCGISKFNKNIFLKNHFSIFLINEMNDKKKALQILDSIDYKFLSFQANYNISICHRIIENHSSSLIYKKNNFILNHKRDVQQFKKCIKRFSFLYSQFLSLLLEIKISNINNLNKIYELGHQIIKLNYKIHNLFNIIINTKTDNFEVIKLYSDFVETILKDKEKGNKCNKLKKLFHNTDLLNIKENDYSNFNLEFLKENSKIEFLIITAGNKDIGNIMDCSLNLCKDLGYRKKELIGNHINILMPEIFHHKHNSLVAQNSEKNKLDFLKDLNKNKIYIPSFIQKDVYCITKTKFLIPLNIKIYLINSEENKFIYIAEIVKNFSINKDLLNKSIINSSQYCILTDNNFLIQSFTPNCLNFLNINYKDINRNISIINFIKQFKADYLSILTDSNTSQKIKIKTTKMPLKDNNDLSNKNISLIEKQKLKTELFDKKYNKKCKITWTPSEKNSLSETKITKEKKQNSSLNFYKTNKYLKNKLLNEKGIELYMEAKKIILDNELLGYYFYFSKIFFPQNKCYLKYKLMDGINFGMSDKLKKKQKNMNVFLNL